MKTLQPESLVALYDGLLLDAFGVLVDASGRLEIGRRLLAALEAEGKPFCVVTNDASRLPETASRRFAALGLEIPPERILSSGSLLEEHFRRHDLIGARARVHGPEDSRTFAMRAGAEVLEFDSEEIPEVLVVCDESGGNFLDSLDRSLTLLLRALEQDRLPHLVLANPDLQFPKGERAWGFTAGAVALLLEAALSRHFSQGGSPRFHRLGKPGADLLLQGAERIPAGRLAMVGDQWDTDIAAANAAGLHSVLVADRLPTTARLADSRGPSFFLHTAGYVDGGTSLPTTS